jgi:hypothetical protein
MVLLASGEVFQLGGSNTMDKNNVPSDQNEASGIPGLQGKEIV